MLHADDESKNGSKAGNDSEADSPMKSGSPGGFDELNSQTQRVLRGIVSSFECRQSFICKTMPSLLLLSLQTVQSVT